MESVLMFGTITCMLIPEGRFWVHFDVLSYFLIYNLTINWRRSHWQQVHYKATFGFAYAIKDVVDVVQQ